MNLRYLYLLAAFVAANAATDAKADIITQFDFNGPVAGTTTPNIGTGVISLTGGTSATFASGDASGGSSDPATPSPPDFGYNTTTYPGVNAANETAGILVMASTFGYSNIKVNFDLRHSNTSSRYISFYYTTDGSTFNRLFLDSANSILGVTPAGGSPSNVTGNYGSNGTFDGRATSSPGDDWFNGWTVDLSSISGASENSNFGFKIVSSFDGGSSYIGTATDSYAGGTWRFDMVTVSGEVAAVPEPSSMILCGIFACGAGYQAMRRRFRRMDPATASA